MTCGTELSAVCVPLNKALLLAPQGVVSHSVDNMQKLQKNVGQQIQFVRPAVIIMHEERCRLGSRTAYAALRPIQAGRRAAKVPCSCMKIPLGPTLISRTCEALLGWDGEVCIFDVCRVGVQQMIKAKRKDLQPIRRRNIRTTRWANNSMLSFHSGILHECSSSIDLGVTQRNKEQPVRKKLW